VTKTDKLLIPLEGLSNDRRKDINGIKYQGGGVRGNPANGREGGV